VQSARAKYGVSERRACGLLHQWRGTQRYVPLRRGDEDQLTTAIIALAGQYGRYGYRRWLSSLAFGYAQARDHESRRRSPFKSRPNG
jgi:hypothetical protein